MRGCSRPGSTKLRRKDSQRSETRTICSLWDSVPWRALFCSPTHTPLDILGSPAPHAFLEFFSLTVQEREGSRVQIAGSLALLLSACQIHGLPSGHRAGLAPLRGPGPPGQSGDGHSLRTEIQAGPQIQRCSNHHAPHACLGRHTWRWSSCHMAEVGVSKATFQEAGMPVTPGKMPCYLGFCWRPSHSHRSSSCGLSPMFITEGNTHSTVCLVKMKVCLFPSKSTESQVHLGLPHPQKRPLETPEV